MLLITLLACFEVVKYGNGPEPGVDPEVAAQVNNNSQTTVPRTTVDWTAREAELSELMTDGSNDADRQDRLQAAHALAVSMRDGDDPYKAVDRYLAAVATIEARAQPEEIPTDGFQIGGGVVEETIDTAYDTGLGPEDVRALLAEDRYQEAVEGLRPTRDQHPELWQEAVDGWVHSERERAGALFLQAREMPAGEVRESAFDEVEAILSGLLRDYPETRYAQAIDENLTVVRSER